MFDASTTYVTHQQRDRGKYTTQDRQPDSAFFPFRNSTMHFDCCLFSSVYCRAVAMVGGRGRGSTEIVVLVGLNRYGYVDSNTDIGDQVTTMFAGRRWLRPADSRRELTLA